MATPLANTVANNPQAQQLQAQLATYYPSFNTALNSGKLQFSDLAQVASVNSTMLGHGVYQEVGEPLYDTITLPAATTLSQQYNYFPSNKLNTGVSNLSNSPGQQSLPATMAFLATKVVMSLEPTVYSGYVLNSATQPIDTTEVGMSNNIIDQMQIFYAGSLRMQYLQTEWFEVPIKTLIGGAMPQFSGFMAMAGTYTAPVTAIAALANVQLGPMSTEGIPELKQYMFLGPQESFSIQLKFPSGFSYQLLNILNVTLELQGVKYRSV